MEEEDALQPSLAKETEASLSQALPDSLLRPMETSQEGPAAGDSPVMGQGDRAESGPQDLSGQQEPVQPTSRVHSRQEAPVVPPRSDARDNEETRTPSSCSDGQLEHTASSSDDKDCEEAEVPRRSKPRERCGVSNPEDNLNTQETPLESSAASSSTNAASPVPRLSTTGLSLRGPRPAPALGSWVGRSHASGSSSSSKRAATGTGQGMKEHDRQGPLGHLINWLDDADVGDVLQDGDPVTDLLRPDEGEDYGDDVDEGALPYDEFEEVPSDQEALPRAPPLAPSAAPLMRPLSPPRDILPLPQGYCATYQPNEQGHNEEEEWLARQRLTGAIGRLVRYFEGDAPKDDILGLRSTRRGRIMVTAVREHGAAAKAGVAVGDELVSIDGRKEFVGHPAHVVHASLRAPVTLVFLGFVGKLQAEVRVKRPPEPRCGLPSGQDVVNFPDRFAGVQLCDAVVFQPDHTSLLLATGMHEEYESEHPPPQHEEGDSKTLMWEVQREDARNLIINALGTTAAL